MIARRRDAPDATMRFLDRALLPVFLAFCFLAASSAAPADDPAPAPELPDRVELLVTANLGEACSTLGADAAIDAIDAALSKAIEESEKRTGRRPTLVDAGGFAALELPPGPGGRSSSIQVETPYTFGATPIFVRHRFDAVAIGRRDMALAPAGLRRVEASRYGALPLLGGLKNAATGEPIAGARVLAKAEKGRAPLRAWAKGAKLPGWLFGRGADLEPLDAPEADVDGGALAISFAEAAAGESAPSEASDGAAATLARAASGEPGFAATGPNAASAGPGASLSLVALARDGESGWRIEKSATLWSAPANVVEIRFNQEDIEGETVAAMFGATARAMQGRRVYFPPELEKRYGGEGTMIAEADVFGAKGWRHFYRLEVAYPAAAESWHLWIMVDDDGANPTMRAAGYFPFGQMQVSPQAVADALEKAAREGTLDQPIAGEELLLDAMPDLRAAAKACLDLYK